MSDDWIEFEVDAEFGDANMVEWVTLTLASKTVTYFSSGVGHSVVYADQAAAQLAYNDWIAAHPPFVPHYLVAGDNVILHRVIKGTMVKEEIPTIFLKAPDSHGEYWVFERNGKIIVTDTHIVVVKL